MQKRLVDITDEIKILVKYDDGFGSASAIYQGPYGFEKAGVMLGKTVWQDVLDMARKISKFPKTMESLRYKQRLARLIYTLMQEQGIAQTAHQLNDLGLGIRARHAGTTDQAHPSSLPFPYDKPTEPLSELQYSSSGSWYHFYLNADGDEIAFFSTARPTRYWTSKDDIGPMLADFAVKRLFDIYKSDTSSFSHLAWVQDLNFAADLGL